METLGKKVGARIEKLRVSRGHSRERVAQGVAIDPVTLYRIERAKQGITLENIDALANYFSVVPAVFFTDDVVKILPTPDEALEIVAEALHRAATPKKDAGPDADWAHRVSEMVTDNPKLKTRVEAVLGIDPKPKKKEQA